MKTVSSDNLARFKAKCDETYQKKGEGGGSGSGITEAQVIVQVDEVPATVTADSPSFIQTPDGVLYRKKAVESGGLTGTWVINSTNDGIATGTSYNVGFTSNGNSYTKIGGRTGFFPGDNGIVYDSTTVYTQTVGWDDENFRTINITDISSLTNVDEFTQWLTANATGGGASVSYEYVAMQEQSGGGGGGIEYDETLPTASKTSPSFVQTPDGILYKKYYGNYIPSYNNVQGVWTWDLGANVGWNGTINCNFTSNGQKFSSIVLQYDESSETQTVHYDSIKVYEETPPYGYTWTNKNYEKIDFGNVPQKINAESIFWELYRADIVSESVFITYEYKRICETNNVTFKIRYSSQVPMGSKSYIKPYIKPQSQTDYIYGYGSGGPTLLSSFSFCGEGAVFFVWGSGYRLNGDIVMLNNLTYDNAAQVFLTDGDIIELLYHN